MNYDKEFWDKYSKENDSKHNEEFSKFIRDLTLSLRAKNVLEVGCNTGNDLQAFPENFDVIGIDLNEYALEKAREKYPTFNFENGSITKIPLPDSSVELVFTHKVLNYLDEENLKLALAELFRVSSKYIVTCELLEGTSKENKNRNFFYNHNIFQKWMDYKVKIISNVEMHEDIDPEKSRFVLVRKL